MPPHKRTSSNEAFFREVSQSFTQPRVSTPAKFAMGGIGCLWLLGVVGALAIPVLVIAALCRYLGWL